MRLINMTCPNCGSQLQIDLDNKQATCQYCGNALLIDDGVQHVQYDNAEKAGYEFEKGRQRAQAEQSGNNVSQTATVKYWQQPQQKKKNNNMVWWVLGWIFFFPIPLTILLVRNKTMNPKVKYGIIAGMWIIILIIGLASNSGDNDKSVDTNTTGQQTNEEVTTESSTEETSEETSEKTSEKTSEESVSSNPFEDLDNYYTFYSYPGTDMATKVITFEERKRISFPSARGLYVGEIMLLEYCKNGKYPKPKSGYPGFWWV